MQFLLDATLGFINIAQNKCDEGADGRLGGSASRRVLVAGIYGMNFKSMPEYDWSWGYAYGLALIVVTGSCRWPFSRLAQLDLMEPAMQRMEVREADITRLVQWMRS